MLARRPAVFGRPEIALPCWQDLGKGFWENQKLEKVFTGETEAWRFIFAGLLSGSFSNTVAESSGASIHVSGLTLKDRRFVVHAKVGKVVGTCAWC